MDTNFGGAYSGMNGCDVEEVSGNDVYRNYTVYFLTFFCLPRNSCLKLVGPGVDYTGAARHRSWIKSWK